MFHLQQSVEKSAKGFGLLMGILQPNDLTHEVRHQSVIAVILNLHRLMDLTHSIFGPFMSLDFEHVPITLSPLGRQLRKFQKGLEKPLQSITPSDEKEQEKKLESALEEIRDYKGKFGTDARMWKATMSLDENDDLVAIAMQNLRSQRDNKLLWKSLGGVFPLISRIKKMQDHSFNSEQANAKMKFAIELFTKGPKVLPLCILTEWHEQEPRYPRIGTEDYWDPASYDSKSPLVKLSRQLIRESSSLSKSVIHASKLALQIPKP
jgi:hypothetical protein